MKSSMFCQPTAMTICSTQTELAVTVTCQRNTSQINLQLQSIKMHDAKLIRQAYYTICLNDSSHAGSTILQNTVVRGAGICSILWALTWLATVAKVKARGLADLILLAVPSGLQTNLLSLPDRHRKRQMGNTGPESPAQTLLILLSKTNSSSGLEKPCGLVVDTHAHTFLTKPQKAWQNCLREIQIFHSFFVKHLSQQKASYNLDCDVWMPCVSPHLSVSVPSLAAMTLQSKTRNCF